MKGVLVAWIPSHEARERCPKNDPGSDQLVDICPGEPSRKKRPRGKQRSAIRATWAGRTRAAGGTLKGAERNDSMASDIELVQSVNKGNADAFDALYDRHRDWV